MARRIKGDGQGKERSKILLYEFLNVAFLPLYLYAMELSFALRKGVEVRKIEAITNIQNCITVNTDTEQSHPTTLDSSSI